MCKQALDERLKNNINTWKQLTMPHTCDFSYHLVTTDPKAVLGHQSGKCPGLPVPEPT